MGKHPTALNVNPRRSALGDVSNARTPVYSASHHRCNAENVSA